MIGVPSTQDAAGARPVQPGDEAQQGGLAAAARPEQGDELAGLGAQIDAVEHRQQAALQLELVADVADLERVAGAGGSIARAAATIARAPSARRAAGRAGGTAG